MKFPNIDPVFLSIGPLQFRWYGLMYVLAFIATYFIIRSEVKRKQLSLTTDDVADLVFYGAMGVVLGGRLGYILFYNLAFYLSNPLKLLAVWKEACLSTAVFWEYCWLSSSTHTVRIFLFWHLLIWQDSVHLLVSD
jgi:prolipoprotein diacylglyceryl transferase